MFQSPKSTTYVAPAEPIDVNQRYLVRVMTLQDLGLSKYWAGDPDDPEATHRIKWVFRLGKMDGSPVLDMDGNPYEHFDYTSSKTSKGKKTAQARLWMEALLGPLEDSEIDGGIAERLKGKVASALFEEVPAQGEDGTENLQRIRILRLTPYTKKGEPAVAAPVKAAKKELEEVAF